MTAPLAVLDTLALRELIVEAVGAGLARHQCTPPPPEPLLDRAGVAAWAGCSTRTVDGWLRAGVPRVRLGGPGGSPRMLASEIVAWLRDRDHEDFVR